MDTVSAILIDNKQYMEGGGNGDEEERDGFDNSDH